MIGVAAMDAIFRCLIRCFQLEHCDDVNIYEEWCQEGLDGVFYALNFCICSDHDYSYIFNSYKPETLSIFITIITQLLFVYIHTVRAD